MKNFKSNILLKSVALVVSILISCPYAYAAEIGIITHAEGRVDVLRPGQDMATPIREGDFISIGDSVRTKSNAKAEVTFKDKSIVRLAQNTKADVKDYQLYADNKRKTATISIERGKVRTIIAKMPDAAEFVITTPNAKGTVKGSDIFTTYQAGNSNMLVSEGTLYINNMAKPDAEVTVPAGNSVIVPLEESPQGPRPYFDLEKKLFEEDTSMPPSINDRKDATSIKGVLIKISGDVRIKPKDAASSREATLNDIVNEGDTIETGNSGLVEIKLDNGNGLNLKPNTTLIFTKLVIDPKTEEYENILYAANGKIRARIENLKGKSKFEVKTPTAISGARGTVMYIEINPLVTKSYFEGGTGYLKSMISNIEKAVEAGMTAYGDTNGVVSDPANVSDGDRMDWGSGWDPGNGTEGYSSSGGATGVFLGGIDAEDVNIEGRINRPAETSYEPFNDVPFERSSGSEIHQVILPLNGYMFNDVSSYGDAEGGKFAGVASITDEYFWNGQTSTLISIGEFSGPNEPFIWYSARNRDTAETENPTNEGFFYSYNPQNSEARYTTSDGGAFFGITAGIGVYGVLSGFAKAIYIDPNGKVGVAGGKLAGLYDNIAKTFLLSGMLTGTDMPEDMNIGVAPQDLYSSIWKTEGRGSLEGGHINGYDNLLTISLVNHDSNVAQDWGIYSQQINGSFSNDIADNWTAKMGGHDPFGAYYGTSYPGSVFAAESISGSGFENDYGYWIADITGDRWNGGILSGSLSGKFMTYTKMGEMSGDIFGTYDADNGRWQAVGAGFWQKTEDLKFVSNPFTALFNTNEETTTRYEGEYKYYSHDRKPKIEEEYTYFYYANGKEGFVSDVKYEHGKKDQKIEYYYHGDGTYKKVTYDYSHGKWEQVSYSNGTWELGDLSLYVLPERQPDSHDYHYEAEKEYSFLSLSEGDGNGPVGLLGGTQSFAWGSTVPATFMGEYEPGDGADNIWRADLYSYNYKNNTYTTYDGNSYKGYFVGLGQEPRGVMAAFYVDTNGDAGYISGMFDGDTYPEIGMFELTGELKATKMAGDTGISPEELYSHEVVSDELTGSGRGGFNDGGQMSALSIGQSFSLVGQEKWGIWYNVASGSYEGEKTSDWKVALGGFSEKGGHWLGTISGKSGWEGAKFTGTFKGISLYSGEYGKLEVATMSGKSSGGYIEAEGDSDSGTWKAVSAGGWVEVSELFDPMKLGYGVADLANFVSVPITEAYSSVANMSGSFNHNVGNISGVMDISFYSNNAALNNGIWAALISGTYSGMPANVNSWTATVAGNTTACDISATITGVQWSGNNWLGTISSNHRSDIDFSGQVGGTYTPTDQTSGTMTGAGSGTWDGHEAEHSA